MTLNPEDIGVRLRLRRQELGLTQAELGKRLGGLSHAAISDIERGRTSLTMERLEEISRALETDWRDFLGERGTTTATLRLLERIAVALETIAGITEAQPGQGAQQASEEG